MTERRASGLIDPLVHLDDPRYEDLSGVLHRADHSGVRHLVWAGTEPMTDKDKKIPPAESQPNIWRALGWHPAFVQSETKKEQLGQLQKSIDDQQIVAIGEIGLDARNNMPDILLQEEIFMAQLEMARDAALPVIIHAAKAWGRVLMKLKHFGKLPAGGLLHAFGASAEMVPQFAQMDLIMSFGGLATHERAKKMRAALKTVPLNLLAVESDGPDHPWVHAKRPLSEPSDLPHIFNHLSEIRGEIPGVLAISATQNLHRLFPQFQKTH